MSKQGNIIIKGARVHNLKGIDVEIPRNQLVVITGFRLRVSRRWPSIRFTPRATLLCRKPFVLCPPVSWTNGKPEVDFIKEFLRPLPSNKR